MKVNFFCDVSAFPDDAFPKDRKTDNHDRLPEKNYICHLSADPSYPYQTLGQNHVPSINEEAADIAQQWQHLWAER